MADPLPYGLPQRLHEVMETSEILWKSHFPDRMMRSLRMLPLSRQCSEWTTILNIPSFNVLSATNWHPSSKWRNNAYFSNIQGFNDFAIVWPQLK